METWARIPVLHWNSRIETFGVDNKALLRQTHIHLK